MHVYEKIITALLEDRLRHTLNLDETELKKFQDLKAELDAEDAWRRDCEQACTAGHAEAENTGLPSVLKEASPENPHPEIMLPDTPAADDVEPEKPAA